MANTVQLQWVQHWLNDRKQRECGIGDISMDCSTYRGASMMSYGATTLPHLYK